MRSRIKSIKILVSVAALAMAMRLVNPAELKESLLSIPLSILFLVVISVFLSQLLSSYKWWLLASSGGISVSWSLAFKAYFFGMFVNWFGLGTIGGDVARGLVLGSPSRKKATALASVFADRVHGLTVLVGICLTSMVAFGRGPIGGEFLIFLIVSLVAVVLGWYLGPAIALRMLPNGGALHRKMQEIAGVFPRNIATVAYVSAVSLLFHLLQISTHQVMAYGFGIHIPWRTLLITIPVVNVFSTLPISWNGLGVRENGYVFFLTPIILSHEQAIAFGAMWLLATATSSAIGGVISFFSPEIVGGSMT
jgi:glycosyltransferase 2 family protein